jgi:pyruvate dehydrogenase E1 component beta subunit
MTTTTTVTYDEAIDLAVAAEMALDSRIFFIATDPPAQLEARFGAKRVRQVPISEPSLTGMCVGAAICGLRPIFLWRNVTFGFGSLDPIFNQAAKLRYMLGGQVSIPLVVRANYGSGTGLAAQHMQSPYAMFAAMPGLKVVAPATGQDAYLMMRSAIRDDNPVVFFEGVRLSGRPTDLTSIDELDPLPLGRAKVVRQGSDVTVVTIGYMLQEAMVAADDLSRQGVEVEVIDLRSLMPLDTDTVISSVQRTRRLIVVDEAPPVCSMASEVVAAVCEVTAVVKSLRSAPRRLCSANVPIPFSKPLEQAAVPSAADIVSWVLADLSA